jgi:uncharacterized protein YbcI
LSRRHERPGAGGESPRLIAVWFVDWEVGRDAHVEPRSGQQLDPPSGATSPLLEISNATVRLYKETFGHGPTHARFAGPDTLVVLLQDTMTVSERNLAALGEHKRLREHRQLLWGAMENELRAVVERILARRTLALISGVDIARDVAAEVFLLAPALELAPQP